MPQTNNQKRASDAVASWLALHDKNPAWLVDATGADPGTISTFLNQERWPKLSTQGKIEKALGWPPGTIRQIGNGADVPPDLLTPPGEPAETTPVGAGVDPELLAELAHASPDAIEAVRAVLRAAKGG
ncbi:hypothetical protein [Nocardioides massiliensis]|uniref:XRE family transcriptional regulator n=1 Tax=Nocardioides massiliensis TaxID=1325935 RepID=A0ABT9NKR3_9ACTN|nr:hypothetical protein [Nocardioides massiliensis]MDP9820430.1 hypothetical protein [Nocardioides massiliensis]